MFSHMLHINVASCEVRQLFEAHLREVLIGATGSLTAWVEKFQPLLLRLLAWEDKLKDNGAPLILIERLSEWAFLDSESSMEDRFSKLETGTTPKRVRTFSACENALRWRTFLEEIMGVNSEAYRAAMQWMPAIGDETVVLCEGAG